MASARATMDAPGQLDLEGVVAGRLGICERRIRRTAERGGIRLRANVEFVATKKGMATALALAAHGSTELSACTSDRLTGAVRGLMDRAAAAGELRGDVGPGDLLRLLVALCHGSDAPGWQDNVLRLLDVFIDGLQVVRSPSID